MAQRLLQDLEAAGNLAREVGQGQHGTLRLSHSSSVPWPHRYRPLRSYLDLHPGVNLEIVQQSSEQQLADLQEGRLDVCLLRLPVLRQYPGLALQPLYREALLLAVAADHPLAAEERPVALARLADEPFVSVPHMQRGGLSYRAAELCLRQGFFPARPAPYRARPASCS